MQPRRCIFSIKEPTDPVESISWNLEEINVSLCPPSSDGKEWRWGVPRIAVARLSARHRDKRKTYLQTDSVAHNRNKKISGA